MKYNVTNALIIKNKIRKRMKFLITIFFGKSNDEKSRTFVTIADGWAALVSGELKIRFIGCI